MTELAKPTKEKCMIRIWCVGSDETEYYAADSEDEVKQYLVSLIGKTEAEAEIAECFREVPQSAMDVEFDWNDDGRTIKTTWRKQIEGVPLPCQVSTGYN